MVVCCCCFSEPSFTVSGQTKVVSKEVDLFYTGRDRRSPLQTKLFYTGCRFGHCTIHLLRRFRQVTKSWRCRKKKNPRYVFVHFLRSHVMLFLRPRQTYFLHMKYVDRLNVFTSAPSCPSLMQTEQLSWQRTGLNYQVLHQSN